jgi:MFS family permease
VRNTTSKISDSEFDAKKETSIPDAIESSSSSTEKTGAVASLRIPSFRLLFTGSILSYAIQWVQQVILSWLAYDLTGSGTILGSISLVSSAASMCMFLVVGFLADYFNRRKLMMIETGCMFILTLSLGFTLLTGHSNISYLFIFSFICGLIQNLDSTLRQVLVFDLVPRSQTPGAIALIQTGWSTMRVLGPSIGGLLLLWLGAGGSFLVQGSVYALVAITVMQMKLPERKRDVVQSSPLQNIREGLGYLVREPVTRVFTLIGIIMPILVIPIFATLPPIYAVQVFGDDSGRVLGFLMASVGVGGIIGGVATNYLRRMEHWGRLQLVSLFLVSLTLIAFAYSSSLPVALALLALAGFFEIIFLTTNQTLIQLSISDNLRARVTAVVNLTWILSPLGSLLAGAGSDLLGGPIMITIILAIVAAVIVIIISLASPTVRNYRLSQGIATISAKTPVD